MKSGSSIEKIRGERHLPKRINRFAIIAAAIALVLVAIIILTFIQADKIMRAPGKELASFTSNIMPDYRLATFPSLDEQTRLSGWFFPAKVDPISTVVLVHDNGSNRLQFDLDSPALFDYLVNRGFNVLAFDLRFSGQSDGTMSTYGYSEWEDVLAAIQYARQFASTADVVLYGFGSGVSASLMAWEELPISGTDQEDIPKKLKLLTYDRSYIRAVILDTPAISPDEYIRADTRETGPVGRYLLQHTVPYAVRLSAGHSKTSNLVTIISQMQIPALIIWADTNDHIESESTQAFVQERNRLYPAATQVYESDADEYLGSWISDQAAYIETLDRFITRYIR